MANNTSGKYSLEVWFGLAKVKSGTKESVLGKITNAYVNVLCLAKNKADFRQRVSSEMGSMGLMLVRLEDAETFDSLVSREKADRSLYKLADKLLNEPVKIKYMTFHTWD